MIFLGQFPPSIAGSFCFLPVSLSLSQFTGQASIYRAGRPDRHILDLPSSSSSSTRSLGHSYLLRAGIVLVVDELMQRRRSDLSARYS